MSLQTDQPDKGVDNASPVGSRDQASTTHPRAILIGLMMLWVHLPLSADTSAYVLAPGDELSVAVFDQPELSTASNRITSDGKLVMPLVGAVEATGKTPAQLTSVLTDKLRRFLKHPSVTISVVEYRLFYINGEVDKPGGYPYRENLTVNRAIALAGGYTDRASRRKVSVLSSTTEDKERKVGLDYIISPGDLIVVKESFF